MIIQFYDDVGIEGYNLIDIKPQGFKEMNKVLNKYRKKSPDEYNFDDFINLIRKKKWFVKSHIVKKEVYF